MSAPSLAIPEEQVGPTGRSAWMLVISSALVCIFIALASGTHIGLVLVTVPIGVALIFQSPKMMLTVLPVWMVMLGVIRRLTPGGGNITLSGDPVLLIGPICILLLFAVAASRGAFAKRTRLANVVACLAAVAFLESFNPKQGSMLAGLAGMLFILFPMLAFWIGRELLDDDTALLLVRMLAVLGLLAAVYGLIQQFHGLPPWDRAWVTSKGYTALSLGSNVIRAFGPFSSAQEYAAFLSLGLVAWLALAGKATRIAFPLHVAGIATVAVALWFESERTAVFLAVLAIGVMAASSLRLPPYGVLLGGLGAVAALLLLGGHLGSGGAGGTTGVLSNHLVTGIKNPLGASSSLPGHIRATRIGIEQGFKDPFGHGTSSVTLAATRYGHNGTVGTEYDPGNMGIAFGTAGLVLYVLLAWYGIKTCYRAAVANRGAVALFGIGLLMVELFSWTNGDLYSVCWLIWLFLGYLDMKLLRMSEAGELDPVVPEAPTWRAPGARRPRATPT